MVKLSVNVNKIATLRNSRGGDDPHLLSFVKNLIQKGVGGITVHPRPDGRHILYQDVREIGLWIHQHSSKKIELNIEGYPSQKFLTLIKEVQPHQCTLVPDPPTALTSDQGWNLLQHQDRLKVVLKQLQDDSIRSSLFIDPLLFHEKDLTVLKNLSPDRVEFYTGAWAKQHKHLEQSKIPSTNSKPKKNVLNIYKNLSKKIDLLGIGINAGHDLNQKNLPPLLAGCPLIQEVSIGHAFVCESIYEGLEKTIQNYFQILNYIRHTP